jgi:PKD repeat protein
MTAPIAMVVNENYSIYAGQYSSINNAILANVIAYDFTDAQEDLVLFVSDNGGLNVSTPGTYTVEVTVEDEAGHTDVVTFDVMVMAALVTQADIDDAIEDAIANEIQDLIDANVLTEADVEALIEAGTLSETAIQALIDAALPEEVPDTGCGSAINGTSAIFITFSLVLGASAIFFFRRRR